MQFCMLPCVLSQQLGEKQNDFKRFKWLKIKETIFNQKKVICSYIRYYTHHN